MTNAQRTENRVKHRVLSVLTLRAQSALGVARHLGQSVQRVQDALRQLADEGLAHSRREPQYPGGPPIDVWYAGPPKPQPEPQPQTPVKP